MIRHLRLVLGCLLLWSLVSSVHAQTTVKKTAAELLPGTTKGFVSIPNMDSFVRQFEATEFGILARDPVMKPFADDFQEQLRTRFGNTGEKLGISWDDLRGVYHGEASLALIQPEDDPKKHAIAMLVDTADEQAKLPEVLRKIDTAMAERKAGKRAGKIDGTPITVYELPLKAGRAHRREAIVFTLDSWFVATDDQATAESLVRRYRMPQTSEDSLLNLPEFKTVMTPLLAEAGDLKPDASWFIDPVPYAQVIRSATNGPKPTKPMLEILRAQGFDAIRGIGGLVNLATDSHQVLHRTFIHAPADAQAATGERFRLAARMMDFPNGRDFEAPNWIPQTVASFSSFHWKVRDAFEHSISLVDAIVGTEEFVEKVLESVKTDPNGPKIDLRTALINHLGNQVLVMSDYALPISTKSERLLFAIRVNDVNQVANALEQIFKDDPLAERLEVAGNIVWEIKPDSPDDFDEVKINFGPAVEEEADGEPLKIPNSAVTVKHGYLLGSTSVEFLASVLNPLPTDEQISVDPDFTAISEALKVLGADEDCCRFFARTDATYRASYELIRQGKMPESETVMGRLLNRLLGPAEAGVLRKQRINGKNLPEYAFVEKYLGPAGLYVRTRDDGWLMTGLTLKPVQPTNANARVTSRPDADRK